MKKIFVLLVTLLLTFGTVQSTAQSTIFMDVPANHWAYNTIEKAYQDGIIHGTFTDTRSGRKYFSPDAELTGAEFLTILGRAFYPEEMKAYEPATGAWHAPAAAIAAKYNLMDGAGGVASIHTPLNRYEMAAVICNILEHFGVRMPSENELAAAGSVSEIADYHRIVGVKDRQNVATVFHFGILSGTDTSGTFDGDQPITRAQTTLIYQRLADFLKRSIGAEKRIESEAIPQGTARTVSISQDSGFQAEVLRLVNEERAKHNLSPLKRNQKLEAAAQTRARESAQLFSHTRPNGQDTFSVLKEAGISYRVAGENIAAGHETAQSVVAAWMKSEGHRANILSARYTDIGIGYLETDAEYIHYWAQLFIEAK